MLQRILLEHFKCFDRLNLSLAPLTLLTGLNASGKSTILQALALLHQTLTENPSSPGLVLNGKDVSLGTADELVDKVSGRSSFAVGLERDDSLAIWRMRVESNNMIAPFAAVEWLDDNDDTGSISAKKSLIEQPVLTVSDIGSISNQPKALLQTLRTLTYISADRIGPRETYPASSSAQQTGVGARGEYTPWFINEYEDLVIPEGMCHPKAAPLLKRQVEAWLSSFFPGSGFEIEALQQTNLLVMRLRTSLATNYYRPTNVGYGLSHVLPVLTACLGAVGLAQREEQIAPLVLVENPELHLHPAGQSAMGVFLARAAASGAQVIIETHSDHVLNGIRRAVKGTESDPILTPEQVAIHFFQPRDDEGKHPQVISPVIDKNGNIDTWPEGFFDQHDRDLGSLIGW